MSEAPAAPDRFARAAWISALEATARGERRAHRTLAGVVDECAGLHADKAAIVSDEGRLSYLELAQHSHRYARWALQHGLARGDVVGLVMEGCPEYVAAWLGLTRVGVVVALINTQLRGEGLRHVIGVAQPRRIVVGAGLWPQLQRTLEALGCPVDVRATRSEHETDALGAALARLDAGELMAAESPFPEAVDTALYIYTSGTTGLPKAARVSHGRILRWSYWFSGMLGIGPSDRIYNCLPLYHSVGGIVAVGSALVAGGQVVVRPRFSASRFWDDIVRWDCTVFQYIGELCRILVAEPPRALETAHRIRIACGNGLGGDIWETFRDRFRIPRIVEFYAATEANFSLYNCEGRPGALGRVPPFLAHRFPIALVRFDVAAGAPVRDDQGRCLRCGIDEIGEAISPIAPVDSGSAGRFEGYTDAAATSGKVLRDVFESGDAWYRSGDLMRRDAAGFHYFVDRIGDTFRWKAENVSTTEVAAVLRACAGVADALVFGVAVPGQDGRAGMAALVTRDDFDLAVLSRHVEQALPRYARPVFLRFLRAVDMTGTFKPKTHELAKAGFDPATIDDPLLVLDPATGRYVAIDADVHAQLRQGSWRL
jgi:fatty-acyl-CoA synthase